MPLQPLLFLTSSRFPTSTLIPNPMLFDLLSSCIKSIPDVSLVSRLQSGEAQSHTSLAQYALVCLSLPSIYLFPSCPLYIPLSHHLLPSTHFSMSHPQFPISIYPCFIYLYSIPPSTLISSILILSFRRPYSVILYLPYNSFLIVQINLRSLPHPALV